jgi:hypothetical protein
LSEEQDVQATAPPQPGGVPVLERLGLLPGVRVASSRGSACLASSRPFLPWLRPSCRCQRGCLSNLRRVVSALRLTAKVVPVF